MNRLFGLVGCLVLMLALSSPTLADVPFDGDGDADVGFDDFVLFAGCQQGPDAPALSACIEPFDYEFDNDVDLRDFAAFQLCFSGESLPKFGDCAEHQVRIETGCLHIVGTVADSSLKLQLRAGAPSTLDIDVGNDGMIDFAADRGAFTCILIDTRSGDDVITIDETNGVFTDTEITTVNGGRGNDIFNGGSGGEIFVGGDGADTALMGLGNDRFIWNPGDDTDIVEGNDGVDTVEVNGSNGAETFTVTANGTRVRFDRLSASPFFLDIGTTESLVLNCNGGNDSLACTGNLAPLVQITADGGTGDDTLLGSNGADVLIGGDNNDFIDGQQGADVAFLGEGNDTFQWDPGDGNDVVEGQAGLDKMLFNGSAGAEIFDFSTNGGRVRFTRNLGNIVMDFDDIEQFDLKALGGIDVATVNNLAATDLTQINVDLAGLIGGLTGDAAADSVVVNGTDGIDNLNVTGGATGVTLTGLHAAVTITAAELANDRLTVNALGGNDTFVATGLSADVIGLTVNGGTGNDTLTGSAGVDILNGDDDNDVIIGGEGDDSAQLGLGIDRFIWNPGHGSDIVEGNDGADTVEVNGDTVAEQFTVTANGTRVRFDRLNTTPFFLDIGTCESLTLNCNAGNDSLGCTGNLAPLIQITADGGPGDDTLLGSNGADVLIGGDNNDFIDGQQGADVAFLGDGNDTFQWDPGDGNDIVEGQNGHDILLFNGSAGNEIFDVSANGGRVRFTRNLGNIVMDFDDVEQLDLRALGGVDSATVNSLAGTDLSQVNIDLAGTIGGATGDAAADAIVVNGTNNADTINVVANGGAVDVLGLSAAIRISRSEVANDSLAVNGLGGADGITTGPGVNGLIQLVTNP